MGKEIKFRVWDKQDKVMYEPVSIVNKWINGEEQNYELMQYTGLNDKNGKEIYEGDILEEGEGYYFEVVWEKQWAKFKLQWKNKAYQYPEWNRGINMQVIGNIYDNPELLQEVEQ